MNNHKGIVLGILVACLAACSPINSVAPLDEQQIRILLQNGWQKASAANMIAISVPQSQNWLKTGNPISLYPLGQHATNWCERIDTQMRSYAKQPNMKALQYAQYEIQRATQMCLQVNQEIKLVDKNAVVFYLSTDHCANEKNIQQTAKLFNGEDGVYMVRYSAMNQCVANAEFARMSRVIEKSYLVGKRL